MFILFLIWVIDCMKNDLYIIEIDNNLLFWIESNKNKNKGIKYKQQKILKKIDHYKDLTLQ